MIILTLFLALFLLATLNTVVYLYLSLRTTKKQLGKERQLNDNYRELFSEQLIDIVKLKEENSILTFHSNELRSVITNFQKLGIGEVDGLIEEYRPMFRTHLEEILLLVESKADKEENLEKSIQE